jgi:hypothetical protein
MAIQEMRGSAIQQVCQYSFFTLYSTEPSLVDLTR